MNSFKSGVYSKTLKKYGLGCSESTLQLLLCRFLFSMVKTREKNYYFFAITFVFKTRPMLIEGRINCFKSGVYAITH